MRKKASHDRRTLNPYNANAEYLHGLLLLLLLLLMRSGDGACWSSRGFWANTLYLPWH